MKELPKNLNKQDIRKKFINMGTNKNLTNNEIFRIIHERRYTVEPLIVNTSYSEYLCL
jgi:hypothetical protein